MTAVFWTSAVTTLSSPPTTCWSPMVGTPIAPYGALILKLDPCPASQSAMVVRGSDVSCLRAVNSLNIRSALTEYVPEQADTSVKEKARRTSAGSI